ncbi:MAG: ABC transporter permease [Terracidiphilus sp.]
MQTCLREFLHTSRNLRRSPAFTTTAVVMLAFGIGATTAVFSILNALLLRPLPFPDAGRLVTLGDQVNGGHMGENGDPGWVTAPEVVTYQREVRPFQSLGGFNLEDYELSGVGQPGRIFAARMTPSMFSVLGVSPLLGRVFTEQEDHQKARVAVLSYTIWKSRFNANPDVIGTTFDLNRTPYIVIGVMPKNFEFPLNAGLNHCELWIPMSFSVGELSPEQEANWNFLMVGRLKPGDTVAQAQDYAQRVAARIMQSYPADLSTIHIRPVVYPLREITVGQARPLLHMLFLAVVVVLLVACANLSGLFLVRAIRRQREMAVRMALGAPTRTLLSQTIIESLVISLTGGVLGIGVAGAGLAVGKDFLPTDLPLTSHIAVNSQVAGFALLLALLTGVLCGLAPGLAAVRTNVNDALKEGAHRGMASGAHAPLRSALVVTEIAIALILLCASGLLLRSYLNMSNAELGFQPDHVTTAAFALPHDGYPTQARVNAFNDQVLLRLSRLPGVQSVGLVSALPTGGECCEGFVAEGYVDPSGSGRTTGAHSEVIGNFFNAMSIPLLRGRYLTESDNANSQLVVLVNHEFAQHYWPNQNPIGKRMHIGNSKSAAPWMTVVGELADVKVYGPDTDAAAEFYQPTAQVDKDLGGPFSLDDVWGNSGHIVVRSMLPPEQIENSIGAVIRSIDPQLPLTEVQTMEQVVSQSESGRRFNTVVISSFALAAVLMALLGIYSVVAFSVASRVHEMGLRMALGSQRSAIVRLILVSGIKLAAIGSVLGLAGAAAASKLLRSFLFHVSPFDPLVMTLTAIAIFALALAASGFPAFRAASVDPMRALRE